MAKVGSLDVTKGSAVAIASGDPTPHGSAVLPPSDLASSHSAHRLTVVETRANTASVADVGLSHWITVPIPAVAVLHGPPIHCDFLLLLAWISLRLQSAFTRVCFHEIGIYFFLGGHDCC